MPSEALQHELQELVDAACEETLTAEQLARLESIVLASDEACRYYRECLNFHGGLHLLFDEHRAPLPEAELASQEPTPATRRRPSAEAAGRTRHPRLRSWSTSVAAASIATAAALLLAMWYWPATVPGPPATEIARLTRVVDATWTEETRAALALAPGGKGILAGHSPKLSSGKRLELVTGRAEIVFGSGARVILQGPARFTIESPSSGRLIEGKLAARVPHHDRGFTIHTPDANVVDQGTEFGIIVKPSAVSDQGSAGKAESRKLNADSSSTEVHVFEGQVDVLATKSNTVKSNTVNFDAVKPTELRQGQAVRIDAKAEKMEPLPSADGSFAATRSLLRSTIVFDDEFDDGDIASNDTVPGFVHPKKFWNALNGRLQPSRGSAVEAGGRVTVSTLGKIWREYDSIQSINSFPAAGATFTFVIDAAQPPTNDIEIRLNSGTPNAAVCKYLSLKFQKQGMATLNIQQSGRKWLDNQVAQCFAARSTGWKPGDGTLEIRLHIDAEGYEASFVSTTSVVDQRTTVVEKGKWPIGADQRPIGLSEFTTANGEVFLQAGCHTRRSGGAASLTLDRISVEAPESSK